jgi:urease accessory protein UreH
MRTEINLDKYNLELEKLLKDINSNTLSYLEVTSRCSILYNLIPINITINQRNLNDLIDSIYKNDSNYKNDKKSRTFKITL